MEGRDLVAGDSRRPTPAICPKHARPGRRLFWELKLKTDSDRPPADPISWPMASQDQPCSLVFVPQLHSFVVVVAADAAAEAEAEAAGPQLVRLTAQRDRCNAASISHISMQTNVEAC